MAALAADLGVRRTPGDDGRQMMASLAWRVSRNTVLGQVLTLPLVLVCGFVLVIAVMADPASRAAVGVQDNERIIAIVNIGEPAEVPPAKPRESAATFTVCRNDPVGSQERVLNVTAAGMAFVTRTTTGSCS